MSIQNILMKVFGHELAVAYVINLKVNVFLFHLEEEGLRNQLHVVKPIHSLKVLRSRES